MRLRRILYPVAALTVAAVALPAMAQQPQSGAGTTTPGTGAPSAGAPSAGGATSGTPAPAPPQAVPVGMASVKRQDVPVYLAGLGSVQAFQQVLVRARVDGTLDRIAFTEGDEVKQGDLLAVIDPRPYQATLDQAVAKKAADQAQLENAKLDLVRFTSLSKGDYASRQQLDTARAQVAQLEATINGDDATIAGAKLNLEFTHITSPIEGRVGLRLVDQGNLIHAIDTTGIVTIAPIHPISVVFPLPQDDLPRIMAAMKRARLPVIAIADDNRTDLGHGELLTPDNTIDATTGMVRLKATFPNKDNQLWPGQFVNARLLIDTLVNAMVVPSGAIQHGPKGLFVYMVKPDSTVTVQPVTVTQDDGQQAVVAAGLTDGTQVVVSGQSRLTEGTRVAAIPAAGG